MQLTRRLFLWHRLRGRNYCCLARVRPSHARYGQQRLGHGSRIVDKIGLGDSLRLFADALDGRPHSLVPRKIKMHKRANYRLRRCREPSRSVMPMRQASGYTKIQPLGSKEWSNESPEFVLPEVSSRKAALMGLPCMGCRLYYDATLDSCPVCGCKERVSPQGCGPITHVSSGAA